MKYTEIENIFSNARMSRYVVACGSNTKKAMTLYRLNLRLSQEFFTHISCFEISLRNAINDNCIQNTGNDWLRNEATTGSGGIFDNWNCRITAKNINDAVQKLNHSYTHNKLVAELGFGFWRYMFAQHQFSATGRILLRVFPAKPTSTPSIQYNHTFIFNQLALVNNLRNRIAHHEPVCFQINNPIKSTIYERQHYTVIQQLFQWMNIDSRSLLYGIDHISTICNQVDAL